MSFYDGLDCSEVIPLPSKGNPFHRIMVTKGHLVGRGPIYTGAHPVVSPDDLFVAISNYTGKGTVFLVWILDRCMYKYTVYGEFVDYIGEKLKSDVAEDTVFECYEDADGTLVVLDVVLLAGKVADRKPYMHRIDTFMDQVQPALSIMVKRAEVFTVLPPSGIFYSVIEGRPVMDIVIADPIVKKNVKVVKKGFVDVYETGDGERITVRNAGESRFLAWQFNRLDVGDFRYLQCAFDQSLQSWFVAT